MRISGPNAEGFYSEVQRVAATFSPTVDINPGEPRLAANFRLSLPLPDRQYNYLEGAQQTPSAIETTDSAITVRSRRLPAMKRALSVSNQLLARNVPFIAQDPQYTFSGLKRLRPVLTAEATADSRVRARAALGRNGHLGRSNSISVGQFSVDAPGSVNIGSGDYYTGSVQQVVSVAVSATYSTSS